MRTHTKTVSTFSPVNGINCHKAFRMFWHSFYLKLNYNTQPMKGFIRLLFKINHLKIASLHRSSVLRGPISKWNRWLLFSYFVAHFYSICLDGTECNHLFSFTSSAVWCQFCWFLFFFEEQENYGFVNKTRHKKRRIVHLWFLSICQYIILPMSRRLWFKFQFPLFCQWLLFILPIAIIYWMVFVFLPSLRFAFFYNGKSNSIPINWFSLMCQREVENSSFFFSKNCMTWILHVSMNWISLWTFLHQWWQRKTVFSDANVCMAVFKWFSRVENFLSCVFLW